MRLQHPVWSVLVAAVLVGLGSATAVQAAGEQFLPILVARGVECYERLKARGSMGAAVLPLNSTPLAYALTDRAT